MGFLAVALLVSRAFAQTPGPQDYRLVVQVPRREADQWLKSEVAKSGGNLDRDRYHFVLGFSTGHYGSDPVQAIAMRRLAFSLLNNTLAAGDRVTPVAWELSVWNVGKSTSLTGDAQSRGAVVDEVPYAPAEQSRGGHDTERALYDTLERAVPRAEAPQTIVLLFTNTNQSQGPTGQRVTLFGANNSRLLSAIRERGYRDPVRHSFAARTRDESLNIDVTALFPKALRGIPGAPAAARFPTFARETWQPPADRPEAGEDLPNVTIRTLDPDSKPARAPAPGVAASEPKGGTFPWPLVLLGLVVAGVTIYFLTRKKPRGEATAQAAPGKGRPVAGRIQATLGTAPAAVRTELKPLTTASQWTLVQDGDGRPALMDDQPEGARLAGLRMSEQGRLLLEAEPDVAFQQVQGVRPDTGNPRLLTLRVGDHLVCRIAAVSTTRPPLRCEIVYTEK